MTKLSMDDLHDMLAAIERRLPPPRSGETVREVLERAARAGDTDAIGLMAGLEVAVIH